MIKKIYIADDEKNIRELIFTFLTNEGFAVTTFLTGDELYDCFCKDPADLVILDIMMPGTDGLILSSKLRQMSNVPIIIVSARDSEIDKITGISLGSDDYLTKPFSPMELVARVKSIFRRMELNTGLKRQNIDKFTFADMEINVEARNVLVKNEKMDLTPTEFALIIYLIENHQRAVSREELLKNVWKFDFDVDTRATDDVIKRLRKKLVNANSTARIDSVWGFGFKLEDGTK